MGKSLVLNRRPKRPAEDTAAFGAIAERFRRAGALEQAVSLCREGLQKYPDHVSARVTLGWSLLDLGKYDEARVELEQVMRRAPDNLAAIRGLAELHDRFEHTLNLPMDGPGQWPPPPDSVDEGEPAAEAQGRAFQDLALDDGPSMVPPEMGLPLWTPGPEAAGEVEAVANALISSAPASNEILGLRSEPEPAIETFARTTAPVVEPPAPARDPAPASAAIPDSESVLEVVVEASPEPVTGIVPEPVAEIAPEPLIEAVQEPVVEVAAAASIAVDDLGVSDDALAALIAEADSLEAAALREVAPAVPELEVALAASSLEVAEVEVDPSVAELKAAVAQFQASTPEPVTELAVVQFDAGAPEPAAAIADIESTPVELESGSVAFAAAALELDDAPIELAPPADALVEAEPAIELAEDLFELTAPVALIGDVTDEAPEELESVETITGTPLLDAIVELPEPVEVEPVVFDPEPVVEPVAALAEVELEPAVALPEPVAAVVEPIAAVVEVELEAAVAPAEPDVAVVEEAPELVEPIAALVEVGEVPDVVVAEELPVVAFDEPVVVAVAAAPVPRGVSTIRALERLMSQVKARRAQLMAESAA